MEYIVLLILVSILCALIVTASICVWVFITDIRGWRSCGPWVGTRSRAIPYIVDALDMRTDDRFVLYEIGSGDGRMARAFATKFRNADIVGVDFSYPLVLVSRIISRLRGIKNVKFIYGNALDIDLHKTNVVYCYNLPGILNGKLGEKFKKELRPGTVVLSYCFELTALHQKKMIQIPNNGKRLFMYVA